MSWFEINKLFASIILALIIIVIIAIIGNTLIKPEIPQEQAYLIDVPEENSRKNNISEDSTNEVESVIPILASSSLENGQKIAKKCSSCHNFKKGEPNKIGPNLFGIVNANIGKQDGYAYSGAMASYGGKWSYEELALFLYKPKNYMEGTKMNFVGLKKVEDRADLILWLRENAETLEPLP